jgi:hypothetical protein
MQKYKYILPSQAQIDALQPGDKFVYLGADHGDDLQYTLVTVTEVLSSAQMFDFLFEGGQSWVAWDDEVGLPAGVRMTHPSTATLASPEVEALANKPLASPMADTLRDLRGQLRSEREQLTSARQDNTKLRAVEVYLTAETYRLRAELAETREQLARANEAAEQAKPAEPQWQQVLDGQVLVRGDVVRTTTHLGSLLPGTAGYVASSYGAGRYPHIVIFAGSSATTAAAPGELEVRV